VDFIIVQTLIEIAAFDNMHVAHPSITCTPLSPVHTSNNVKATLSTFDSVQYCLGSKPQILLGAKAALQPCASCSHLCASVTKQYRPRGSDALRLGR